MTDSELLRAVRSSPLPRMKEPDLLRLDAIYARRGRGLNLVPAQRKLLEWIITQQAVAQMRAA